MGLITESEVRRITGVSTDALATGDQINEAIREAEAEVSRYLNAAFVPVETIDVLDGNNDIAIILPRNPVLALRELKIDGTSITIAGNVFVSRNSGKLELNTNGTPEESRFRGKIKSIIVKYVHGWLIESEDETTTTSASIAGTSIALAVTAGAGFQVKEWVEVFGMDGFRESAQITTIVGNTITVDVLRFAHESGSIVRALKVDETVLKLMRAIAGISIVAKVLGESFDDITGYTMGEFQVQKGEPYTQWRETAIQLQKEAKSIMERLRPRPAIF